MKVIIEKTYQLEIQGCGHTLSLTEAAELRDELTAVLVDSGV